jgi:hypothetical protein
MFYGEGSKRVRMDDLLADNSGYPDATEIQQKDYFKEVLRMLEETDDFDAIKSFLNEDENDTSGASPINITIESLGRYRKNGPFSKLHNIGVYLRQSSQLKSAFLDAQRPSPTLLSWVYTVATRWLSNYAMASRALELRAPLNRLLADIKS